MTQIRPAVAITPGDSDQGPRKSSIPVTLPSKRTDSESGKPRPSGITVSKQWVLPPRPKPGRKPKPRPEAQGIKKSTRRPSQAHGIQSPGQALRGSDTDITVIGINSKSKTENAELPHGSLVDSKVDQLNAIETKVAQEHSHNDSKIDDDGESCGLCSRDDCMCETIGLKPDPTKPSLPPLDMILNSVDIRMDAVPLIRSAANLNRGSGERIANAPKFARLEDFQPLQPTPVFSVPSPLEGLQFAQDGCGFCTEGTACACAESMKEEANSNQTPFVHSMQTPALSTTSVSSTSSFHGLPDDVLKAEQRAYQTYGNLQSTMGKSSVNPQDESRSSYSQIIMQNQLQDHTQAKDSLQASVVQRRQEAAIITEPSPSYVHFDEDDEEVYGCKTCQREAMSMLFCVSLRSAQTLLPGAVAIPCHLAVKTLQKHPKFGTCDLGRLIGNLEVRSKEVGVQSINRALQELERGVYS